MSKKNNINRKFKFLFKVLNINNSDNILLHSNSAGLLQYSKSYGKKNQLFNNFFNSLLSRLGKNGTLVVPTYNYDFAKGKQYDYDKKNSQVGDLSNFFLKKKGVKRSYEPIFSHAIKGKLVNKMLKSNINNCFGKNSIFEKFKLYNFKIFGFCCLLNSMTFLHYIENEMKVKYRFNKKFRSIYIKDGKSKTFTLKYFVGKKKIKYNIRHNNVEKVFKNKNNFREYDFGKFYCWTISAKSCFKIIKNKIKKKNNYLIN